MTKGLHLALLAGGRSTRMGRDKAELLVDGEPLLVRLARLGHEAGLPILICGRAQPTHWRGPAATWLIDDEPDQGPLRGLEAALAHADEVVLLACDLPRFTSAALAWICGLPAGELGAAICCADELQPLASRYTVACLPVLRGELASGRRSPRKLLSGNGFIRHEVPPLLRPAFADADDAQDWQRLGLA